MLVSVMTAERWTLPACSAPCSDDLYGLARSDSALDGLTAPAHFGSSWDGLTALVRSGSSWDGLTALVRSDSSWDGLVSRGSVSCAKSQRGSVHFLWLLACSASHDSASCAK